jgi:hypothetical protein
MDGDFVSHCRYTNIYRVCAPFWSMPVLGNVEELSGSPYSLFSLLTLYNSIFVGKARASRLCAVGLSLAAVK